MHTICNVLEDDATETLPISIAILSSSNCLLLEMTCLATISNMLYNGVSEDHTSPSITQTRLR